MLRRRGAHGDQEEPFSEKGHKGRKRALKLLDMAHSALEGSLATGWVDIGLAQAALV